MESNDEIELKAADFSVGSGTQLKESCTGCMSLAFSEKEVVPNTLGMLSDTVTISGYHVAHDTSIMLAAIWPKFK